MMDLANHIGMRLMAQTNLFGFADPGTLQNIQTLESVEDPDDDDEDEEPEEGNDEEECIIPKKKKANTVYIEVTEGHHYVPSVNDGGEFTSVDFNASYYGMGSPCNTEEDVQRAINHAKEWIIREGDIPKVKDDRIKLAQFN